jgi:hypothetical protein
MCRAKNIPAATGFRVCFRDKELLGRPLPESAEAPPAILSL